MNALFVKLSQEMARKAVWSI